VKKEEFKLATNPNLQRRQSHVILNCNNVLIIDGCIERVNNAKIESS